MEAVYSVEQNLRGGHKPLGLWVSVDGEDDWPSWCQENQFSLDRLQIKTRIHLSSAANLLHLKTPRDIDLFTSQYGITRLPGTPINTGLVVHIRWIDVAKHYHGIIIAPYQSTRRLRPSCLWYHGWDCASGCIWDATAVKRIERLDNRS